MPWRQDARQPPVVCVGIIQKKGERQIARRDQQVNALKPSLRQNPEDHSRDVEPIEPELVSVEMKGRIHGSTLSSY